MSSWYVVIQPEELALWDTKFLGLTFLERRLREAKRYGIDCVFLQLPRLVSAPHIRIPKMKAAKIADYVVMSENDIPPLDAHRVPFLDLIGGPPEFPVLFRIQNPADLPGATQHFRRSIISSCHAGWVAKHLNKPISLAMSTRLVHTSLTPNQWSVFNLCVGLLSGWFVSRPSPGSIALGGALFQLASVFDGVDGEIAKFRLENSAFGAWMDSAADNLSLFAFLGGMGFQLFKYPPISSSSLAVLGSLSFACIVAYFIIMFSFVHSKFGSGSLIAYDTHFVNLLPKSDPVVRFSRTARYFIKKDFFSFVFFVVCATGRITGLLYIIALASSLLLFFVIYLNSKYGRLYGPQPVRTAE